VGHGLSRDPIKRRDDGESFIDNLYLDVHEMLEELCLTQEVGVPLDRIRDLSKESVSHYERERSTKEVPCSCPSPPA
jgi:hypothetical protein